MFEKLFKLKQNNTTVKTEVIAGFTTFMTMAYILAVNPSILGDAGMDPTAVLLATCFASFIGTLFMAMFANLPFALSAGMGLNAFMAYTVCDTYGYSWQVALLAVFVEGIVFILLSLTNVREAIFNAIPMELKNAVSVGIGLFICLIGLTNGGVTASDTGTIIGFVNLNVPSALVAIIGLVITIVLFIMNVPGAILIGIILTTIVGIPFGVTTIPEGWKPFSLPEAPLLFQFEWSSVLTGKFFIVFFTFLFTDLFDTIGTLMGVTEQAKLVDDKGNIPNAKGALLADAIGTVAGACLGTSTVTSFVESSSGVAAGARTGLSSVVTAVLFLLALFFTPLFALIPSAATAPALIFVGFLMMKSVSSIDFEDITEGIPAFITIMVMPFAYSISKGIAFGMIAYVICKVAGKKFKDIPVVTWILAAVFIANLVFEAIKA